MDDFQEPAPISAETYVQRMQAALGSAFITMLAEERQRSTAAMARAVQELAANAPALVRDVCKKELDVCIGAYIKAAYPDIDDGKVLREMFVSKSAHLESVSNNNVDKTKNYVNVEISKAVANQRINYDEVNRSHKELVVKTNAEFTRLENKIEVQRIATAQVAAASSTHIEEAKKELAELKAAHEAEIKALRDATAKAIEKANADLSASRTSFANSSAASEECLIEITKCKARFEAHETKMEAQARKFSGIASAISALAGDAATLSPHLPAATPLPRRPSGAVEPGAASGFTGEFAPPPISEETEDESSRMRMDTTPASSSSRPKSQVTPSAPAVKRAATKLPRKIYEESSDSSDGDSSDSDHAAKRRAPAASVAGKPKSGATPSSEDKPECVLTERLDTALLVLLDKGVFDAHLTVHVLALKEAIKENFRVGQRLIIGDLNAAISNNKITSTNTTSVDPFFAKRILDFTEVIEAIRVVRGLARM
jgi:hypothetical protein